MSLATISTWSRSPRSAEQHRQRERLLAGRAGGATRRAAGRPARHAGATSSLDHAASSCGELAEEVGLVDDQRLDQRVELLAAGRVVAEEVVVIEQRLEAASPRARADLRRRRDPGPRAVVEPGALLDQRR